jgi:hypothetical protein
MGHLIGTERMQMGVHDLGIKDRETQFAAPLDQSPKGDLRSIRAAVKHRFRAKARTNGNPIDAANQFPALPTLRTVSPAFMMDLGVNADEVFANPVVVRTQAAAHDILERGVESNLEVSAINALPK